MARRDTAPFRFPGDTVADFGHQRAQGVAFIPTFVQFAFQVVASLTPFALAERHAGRIDRHETAPWSAFQMVCLSECRMMAVTWKPFVIAFSFTR